MRGLRKLAGALALAVWATEAQAQFYPYTPYPQPGQYGYGFSPYANGYTGSPVPYYGGPAPGGSYPGASSMGQGQYGSMPLSNSAQGTGAPPIFMQPPPMPPMPPSNGMSGGNVPGLAQALPSSLPPSPALPPSLPVSAQRPIVVPPPLSPPTFPRSLPSDAKTDTSSAQTANPAPEKNAVKSAPAKEKNVPRAIVKVPTEPESVEAAQPEAGKPGAPVSPPPAAGSTANGSSGLFTYFQNGNLAPYFSGPVDARTPRIWGTAEYLLWWVRNAPLGVPLVTTNPNSGAGGAIGALNEPGTQILLGSGSGSAQSSVNFNAFNGGRFGVGGWLDPQNIFGLEATGFVLERRGEFFSAASAGGGAPVVSIPFNATQPFAGNPAGETSLNGGGAPNTVTSSSYSHLWGLETNLLLNLSNSSAFRLVGIAGFRYVNLTESLFLNDAFFDSTTGGAVVVQDSFGTQNHFFGGQVGLRGGTNWGRFTLDGFAKIAFGDNSQTVNIDGNTSVSSGAFGLTNAHAGVFGEPSNIGRYHHDDFALVPEFNIQVGYLITPYVRPFLGYNFLLLSRALRPGNLIDRNINPSENPTFGGTGGMVSGLPAPLPIFHTSDFWAQGLTVGLEVRY